MEKDMAKVMANDVGTKVVGEISVLRPLTAVEARAALLAKDPLGFDVEELLVGVRAGEAEQSWLDQCSRAVSRYGEGDVRGGALRAMVAVESCPAGKALRFSVLDDFSQCLSICIDSARLHAEEAVLVVSGDPHAGIRREQLTENLRRMARRDVTESFEMISAVATALGGKPAEVLEGMSTARALVPDAGLSQLASTAGGLSALCNLAEEAIADEAARLERYAREVEAHVSDMGLDGFVGAACVSIASQCGIWDQSVSLMEECAELIHAVSKHLRSGDDTTREHLLEEIADVEMMMEQVRLLLGISDDEVATAKLAKAIRTMGRLHIPMDRIGEPTPS